MSQVKPGSEVEQTEHQLEVSPKSQYPAKTFGGAGTEDRADESTA